MHPIDKALFITGTDTDVGKTVVAQTLCYGAALSHRPVAYWKPVQTGMISDSDSEVIQTLPTEMRIRKETYAYEIPASPDQAASHEKKPAPDLDVLLQKWYEYKKADELLIIEGAGGVYVPLNEKNQTWFDFLRATELGAVVVARSGLGTLNHTSLTIEALESKGIPIAAVVMSGPRHLPNETSLKRMFPHIRLLSLDVVDRRQGQLFQKIAKGLFQDLVRPVPKLLQDKNERDLWQEWDRKHCWHPYSQHKTMATPTPLVRASHIYLYTADGERLVDGTSSWWANTIGHGRPEIGAAIYRQQQTLDHTIFAGATHPGAAELAKRLVEISEGQLQRVFYSDNGSCAVEIALKMAIQKASNRGEHQRKDFLSLKGAYHGDTFGAMSVSGTDDFHSPFSSYTFKPIPWQPVTRHPSSLCPEGPESLHGNKERLEAFFTKQHHTLAGVIIEPLVQGASGMNMQDASWTKCLAELCERHKVPLILDEVFTGLGRCGSYFAYLKLGIRPDIVCIAKGLTGGSLPLAATLATEDMFNDFLDDDSKKALYHGHTYTGNAIACAAANETLDLYRRLNLIERSHLIEMQMKQWIEKNGKSLGLEQARCEGAILAFEIPGSGLGEYFNPLSQKVQGIARRHGLFLRPLGNTIYFLPALTITDEELSSALKSLTRVSEELAQACMEL